MNGHDNKCDHCYEPLVQTYQLDINGVQKNFCCRGCLSVFQILDQSGLHDFYKLRTESDISFKAKQSDDSYLYLDQEDFLEKYTKVTDGKYTFEFFIEGVHCVACLWLLEKLPELCSDLLSSKLNMAKSVLRLEVKEGGSLAVVAQTLRRIGYPGHPILQKSDQEKFQKHEDRKSLIRIGVAFAAAGNIMLYSFAVYFGATGFFKYYFNVFSFICFLPIFFYCAIPFYQSAWSAVFSRSLSIDIPIVVALIVGMGMGIFSLITGSDYYYFDTLAILVFLLLLARFSLHKAQQYTLNADDLSRFIGNSTAKRILATKGNQKDAENIEDVLTKFVQKGDKVLVLAGELIPIDGVIYKGKSNINNSLLTGEVKPEFVKPKDTVYMGARNLDQNIYIDVICSVQESRLGKILQEVENGWSEQSRISLLADKISRRFIGIIFILTAFFFSYFLYVENLEVAITRCLTLLIITCPCALALTTPLALILGLSKMAKQGVLIRSELVIELLARARHIFLDKTGTLTYGEFHVESMKIHHDSASLLDKFYSLEKRSQHPVAVSVVEYLSNHSKRKEYSIESFSEEPGVGPVGHMDGQNYSARALSSEELNIKESANTQIGFYENDKLLLSMQLTDQLREGAQVCVQGLIDIGIQPYLLSGDNEATVLNIAAQLPLEKGNVFANQSPEKKQKKLQSIENTIMVGDGANDAIALRAATVGIAVSGSAEVSLRAADVYLSRSGIVHVLNLIKSSRFIIKLIHFNLGISALYNIIGVFLAFTGQVNPLVAAILMPLSSFSVLAITILALTHIQKQVFQLTT